MSPVVAITFSSAELVAKAPSRTSRALLSNLKVNGSQHMSFMNKSN